MVEASDDVEEIFLVDGVDGSRGSIADNGSFGNDLDCSTNGSSCTNGPFESLGGNVDDHAVSSGKSHTLAANTPLNAGCCLAGIHSDS